LDTLCNSGTPVLDNQPPPARDYTEEVGGVSFDMIYIPGGTFTLGCEGNNCPPDTKPVPGVTVSSYHIAKKQVSAALWEAVMGESPGGMFSITWYDAMRFACELSHQTGRAYRMMTEAEFEYAAKNYLGRLEEIGENTMSGEEWAYNSWELTHTGGTDPVGPSSGKHTQKNKARYYGKRRQHNRRLIRSIDGIGPRLRLVVSNEMEYPPGYVPPCELCPRSRQKSQRILFVTRAGLQAAIRIGRRGR
jgi:formylglycine-generating enzyme required for sulfatase activity